MTVSHAFGCAFVNRSHLPQGTGANMPAHIEEGASILPKTVDAGRYDDEVRLLIRFFFITDGSATY